MESVNAINGILGALVGLAALFAALNTYEWSLLTHKSQQTISRSKLILPFWKQPTRCRHIRTDARAAQVMHHLNVLRLVAACCLADAVDSDADNSVLGDDFIELYDEIEMVKSIDVPGDAGPATLTGNEFLRR